MPRAHPPLRRERLPHPPSAQPRAARAAEAPAATLQLPRTRAQAHFFGRQGESGALERGAQGKLETPARTQDRAEGRTRAGRKLPPESRVWGS